jgi:hypothetical protein
MRIMTREKSGPNLPSADVPKNRGTRRFVSVPTAIGMESASNRYPVCTRRVPVTDRYFCAKTQIELAKHDNMKSP